MGEEPAAGWRQAASAISAALARGCTCLCTCSSARMESHTLSAREPALPSAGAGEPSSVLSGCPSPCARQRRRLRRPADTAKASTSANAAQAASSTAGMTPPAARVVVGRCAETSCTCRDQKQDGHGARMKLNACLAKEEWACLKRHNGPGGPAAPARGVHGRRAPSLSPRRAAPDRSRGGHGHVS